MTNPVHRLAIPFLGRMGSLSPGPDLTFRLRRLLDEVDATDPQVVAAALGAIGRVGYRLEDFEGVGGFMNLADAVQKSIRLLSATAAPRG